MREPAPVAYAAIALLAGAAGAVAYLGTRPGPSTPPARAAGATAASAASATPATGATPAASAPATGATAPASASGALRFVPSADLTIEEQVALERLNEVRADPPAFLPAWRARLARDQADDPPCVEPPSMLEPIAGYAPRQPLAASQPLTDAARAHARDMLARGYFEHVSPEGVGSNERVIAAGYPLPVDVALTDDGAGYASARGAGNVESLHMRTITAATAQTFAPAAFAEGIDGLVIDPCVPGRGHRLHLLGARAIGAVELEIGVGAATGSKPDGGRVVSELQLAIEIATRNDGGRFVLGVVYRDADGDGAYDAGEGAAGVDVALPAAGVHTRTAPGGGYALPVPASFTGELVAAGQRRPVTVAGASVKLDLRVD